MPYSFQTKKMLIPRQLDRRVRLTEEQKLDIVRRHKNGEAIRKISRDYEGICTRRVIQYTINPDVYEKLKRNAKKRRAIKGNALQEYGREAWKNTMREHRKYKQSIKNKLI